MSVKGRGLRDSRLNESPDILVFVPKQKPNNVGMPQSFIVLVVLAACGTVLIVPLLLPSKIELSVLSSEEFELIANSLGVHI